MFSLKKYRTFININSTHFGAYTHLGSENIGQIWICPMITFSKVVFFHHVGSFVLLFILIIYNKKIMFGRLWRDNYLLYCNV